MPDDDPQRAAAEAERAAAKEKARPGLIKAELARAKAEAERAANPDPVVDVAEGS